MVMRRLIGTLRHECLDQMIIFGEPHLRRILSAYAAYTIKRARTWHYRKMRPCIEQSNGLVALSRFLSWQSYITNTSGYNFRKGYRFGRLTP